MPAIETLTPEQKALLPAFRDEWQRIGLSCEPIDRAASRTAIEGLYAAGGQPKPAVMFFDGPAQCLLARRRAADANVGSSLWEKLGASLRMNLRATLGMSLGAHLKSNLDAKLRANLSAHLRASFLANLSAERRAPPRDSLSEHTWFWGGQDAPWLACYEFARLIGVRYDKDAHLSGYIAYAKSSGWLYAYPGLALVSDRPEIVVQDNQHRLHCETGPAARFRDGYSVYAWHGETIPAAWIEDRASLTPYVALRQDNAELRRAACEILGWDAILKRLSARTIDKHPDPEIGELVEVTLGGEQTRFLRMTCGTGRRFACNVPFRTRGEPEPFDIDTAWAAQAWIHGETPETFVQPCRT